MPDGDANAERMQMALRRFELPLLQFATRITGDRERARDVVQETFVKFQNNGAFQNPEPATWLFTVCRNGALNVCRKERRTQYLDQKLIEARSRTTDAIRATGTKGSRGISVTDCGDTSASTTGSAATEISKRSELSADRRDHENDCEQRGRADPAPGLLTWCEKHRR
jgi:DNA-directed RNA polymerase specialized sigma24 family protein